MISNDLMKAILAMDSYNRGYDAGITFAESDTQGTQIGNAIIQNNSGIFQIGGERIDDDIGFYALSYDLTDPSTQETEKIIAYRGTDYPVEDGFAEGTSIAKDQLYGWTLGPGVLPGPIDPLNAPQRGMAVEFYKQVVGTGNEFSTDVSLTGHSLGGGLAGYIGALYDQDATIFDTMTFELAAEKTFQKSTTYNVSFFENFLFFKTEQVEAADLADFLFEISINPLKFLIDYSLVDSHLKEEIYGSIDPVNIQANHEVDLDGINGYYVDGEVLEGMQLLRGGVAENGKLELGEGVDLKPYDDFITFPTAGIGTLVEKLSAAFSESVALHSQSLLVIRQFADEQEVAGQTGGDNWEQVGKYFWPVLFDGIFAKQIVSNHVQGELLRTAEGVTNVAEPDIGSYSAILRGIIAYSALNEGEMPFGNTGIRAFYDDANELGAALITAGTGSAVETYGRQISESFVQFSTQLALNDVEAVSTSSINDGILDTSSNSLVIDFTDTTWNQARSASINPVMIGRARLVGKILKDTESEGLIRDSMEALWGNSSANVIDYVTFATDSSSTVMLPEASSSNKASLFIGDTNAQTVTGSNGNDLIIGGGGFDTLNGGDGNDIIIGGTGNDELSGGFGDDILKGNAGENILNGGEGNDVYLIEGSAEVINGNIVYSKVGTHTIIDTGLTVGDEDTVFYYQDYVYDPTEDHYGADEGIEFIEFSDGTRIQTTILEQEFSQNIVTGTTGQDIIGTGADDVLVGTDDDESIAGGDGNDDLSGGDGADSLDGGDADDLLKGDAGSDILDGRDGDDTLEGGTGDDQLFGNIGNDDLSGDDGNDILEGGVGEDDLFGGKGDDTLYAKGQGSLNNRDSEIDTLNGEEGNDFVYGSGGGDLVIGGEGNDYLVGYDNDLLFGDDGSDQLYAKDINARLDGGAGDDYLTSSGDNTIYIASTGDDIILDDGMNGVLWLDGFEEGDLVYERAANHSLIITKRDENEDPIETITVLGHFGNNPLEAISFDSGQTSVTIDSLINASGVEVDYYTVPVAQAYTGGAEDNVYHASVSGDWIVSGGGANTYVFDAINFSGSVTLLSEIDAEQDVIRLQGISSLNDVDLIFTSTFATLRFAETEIIIANPLEVGAAQHYRIELDGVGGGTALHALADINHTISNEAFGDLTGYSINDTIISSGFIDGLAGDDTLLGSSGDDDLMGRTGADILEGNDGNDDLYGHEDDDILSGGAGDDDLSGGDGDDELYGDSGDDDLLGGAGDDNLDGGVGNDTIDGGAGDDLFLDSAGDDLYQVDDEDSLFLVVQGSDELATSGTDLSNLLVDFSIFSETNPLEVSTNFGIVRDFSQNNFDDFNINYIGGNVELTDYKNLTNAPEIQLHDDTIISLANLQIEGHGGFGDDTYVEESFLINQDISFNQNDTVYAHEGDDNFTFLHGNDVFYGGDGNDTANKSILSGNTINGTGSLTAYGEAGDDNLRGGIADDKLYGGDGNDTLQDISGGNDEFYGGDGDDRIIWNGDGGDLIDGGSGEDTAFVGTTTSGSIYDYVINLAAQTITGAPNSSSIQNVENVAGGQGDDTIYGDSNDNIVSGYSGDDVLEAGNGNDTYFFSEAFTAFGSPLSLGDDSIFDTGGSNDAIQLDHVSNGNSLTFTEVNDNLLVSLPDGGSFEITNQLLQGSNNQIENLILSNGTTLDLINYTNWYDPNSTEGTTFVADSSAESFVGDATLIDTVDYSISASAIFLDLWQGSGYQGYASGDTYSSIENIIGSAFNDIILGSDDINDIVGGLGNDILSGGGGDDTLSGGDGDDSYVFYIGDGINTILETSGFDTLNLGAGIDFGDLIFNQIGNDLEIQIASGFIIKDFYSGDAGKVVEEIEFLDGSTFDLTSLLTTTPESPDAINIASTGFNSYSDNQDAGGVASLIYSATGAALDGNAWKKIVVPMQYDVTSDTYITFEYKSTIEGEIQGFGLDTDDNYATGPSPFQIHGTDSPSSFIDDYEYTGAGDWQYFSINVGAHQTGTIDYLTFINDHDAQPQNGNGNYRNVVLYERDPGTINVAPQAIVDEFENAIDTNIVGNLLDDNFHGLDFDVDNDALNTVAETINTTNGSVTILSNGDFTYTPDSGFSGTDSFIYTLEDEHGASDTVTATLYVGTTDADETFTTSSIYEHYNGGAGVDLVDYSTSATRVKLNLGAGIGWGGDSNDDTYVHVENVIGTDISGDRDFIYGSESDNHIWGLAGNDQLEGMGGADTIDGGSGSDYSNYGRSDAAVTVNLKTNVHTGGDAEGDNLISIENINGSDYDDNITGSDGGNKLYGDSGDDLMYGGAGNDTLYGESGADTFIYGATDTIGYIDTIDDFSLSDGDMLDLSDLISVYDPVTDAITDFIQITDSGNNSIVSVDTDGGADNFVHIATLNDITGLTDEAALETSGNLITV